MKKPMQFRIKNWLFTPTLVGVITLIICIPLFIKLGFWQYGKAQRQLVVQAAYQTAKISQALDLPLHLESYEPLKYKKVAVTGHYETKYQLLLDNQVEDERAGFHVITPFKIDGSTQYVLVDRGWILGNDTHTDLPSVSTSTSKLEVVGQVWVPSTKIFTLEAKRVPNVDKSQLAAWQPVWQNMDMEQYKQSVPITIIPVVIRLDTASTAGGFVRNWQIPTDRITTNLGYAYQWFGFAIASIAIFLYMSIKKQDSHSQ